MYLENLVIDALEPQRLGGFWEAVVGGERLTDEPDIVETRLTVEGGPVLDLCFQRVPEPPSDPSSSRRGSTWTSQAAPVRPRRSTGCSGWAPATSTSARATCRGWCSPTPRATRCA